LAIYELTRTDTDAAVVLAEAVALAGDLSTDESPAFLNGVLGSVSRSLSSTAS
jgi:N utilization substance protein B